MSQWLLSVAGIAVLTVLCDVILPEGTNKKYIRCVIGVVITFVILQPLLNVKTDNLQVSINDNFELQQDYLDRVNKQYNTLLENNVKSLLNYYKISNYSVQFYDNSIVVTINQAVENSLQIEQALLNISDNIVVIWEK